MSEEPQGTEIKLETTSVSGNAWLEALKELEDAGTDRPAAAPAAAPKPAPPIVRAAAPAPPTPEGALKESAIKVQQALDALESFVKAHPYLVAPNVYKMWEEYLKETLVTIEQQHAHRIRREK